MCNLSQRISPVSQEPPMQMSKAGELIKIVWQSFANYAGEVSTIRIRFTKQDGSPFPFDATEGPGYVWHCHLLEHEDNEMMRPYIVVSSAQNFALEVIAIVVVALVVVILAGLIVFRRFHNRPKNRI